MAQSATPAIRSFNQPAIERIDYQPRLAQARGVAQSVSAVNPSEKTVPVQLANLSDKTLDNLLLLALKPEVLPPEPLLPQNFERSLRSVLEAFPDLAPLKTELLANYDLLSMNRNALLRG